ncbi:MAG TPA: DUF389 domain-containing protein [Thiobacillaceae bacterium]|nr:DUF389 domain-containing protein [Thiobacillaceae bacterium]
MTQPSITDKDTPSSPPVPPRLFRGRAARLFYTWWRRHMRDLDRDATEEQVRADGGLTYSFAFLVVASCGIATLGLMLNSAAVIIGAMLVAPLMGPIVLLGFSIAETDVQLAKRSALALAVGVLGALSISFVIVKLAPYIPPTPEILARTNPNLFDLLVAVLSGMVAGYAVTHRKIGTVAGVAIATALMPPLAASGYGLATQEWRIFNGAFYLFLTNMLAIAFSVAGMAVWYGFGNLRTPRNLVWQTALATVILVALSIPLVRTLNDSVSKTLIANDVEAVLRQGLDLEGARLDKLDLRRVEGRLEVTAVVFTHEYDKQAQARLEPQLAQRLGEPVTLMLDQVVVGEALERMAEEQTVIASQVMAQQQQPSAISDAQLLVRHLREVLPLPMALSEVNATEKTATLQVAPGYTGQLVSLRQMERELQRRFPDWRIHIIPPLRPLPEVRFARGEADLPAAADATLDTLRWALTRWQVQEVRVTGSAQLNEQGRSSAGLARARAEALAGRLAETGLRTRVETDYAAADQRATERERGQASQRRVRIQPVTEQDETEDATG